MGEVGVSYLPDRVLYSPSLYMARGIEKVQILAEESGWVGYIAYKVAAKVLALGVFPVTLAMGLVVEPLCLSYHVCTYLLGDEKSIEQIDFSLERITKLALGILATPLAFIACDAVSYLFLERVPTTQAIHPFGVENVYGIALNSPICYPKSVEEVQEIVKKAAREGKKIAIIGAGLSQGEQTVPNDPSDVVIDLRLMRSVEFVEGTKEEIKAAAGAIWDDVIKVANTERKSVIAKQAGNVFSVGGTVGINGHGWRHDAGAIASTVSEIEVVTADGDLRTLKPGDELFGAFFGTLGFFGVIVSVTLRLENDEVLREGVEEVSIHDIDRHYTQNIKGSEEHPLLMIRLNIDGVPLQKSYFNTFSLERPTLPDDVMKNINVLRPENVRGKRIERCFLDAVSHLPRFLYDKVVSLYWEREVAIMEEEQNGTRNQVMSFGVRSFFQLGQSDLYTQWLQEYFVTGENLGAFLEFLGKTLHENDVRVLNATVRPVPKDEISVLPYAEQDRYAVVISFTQNKTKKEINKTLKWVRTVQNYLLESGGKWYMAYMPEATKEEFETAYGKGQVEQMRRLKEKYDPTNIFSTKHTRKYFEETVDVSN